MYIFSDSEPREGSGEGIPFAKREVLYHIFEEGGWR